MQKWQILDLHQEFATFQFDQHVYHLMGASP